MTIPSSVSSLLLKEAERRGLPLPVQSNAARSFVTFADLRIWTRDDPPSLVPFTPNPVQADYYAGLCERYQIDPARPWELRGARENILKARQQGFSTFWLALYYLILYNTEYSQSVIVTHRSESTNFLWSRIQMFEKHLPPEKRRPLKYSNRRELLFSDTGSSLLIGTAGADDIARSGTITNVHLSETGFWAPGTDSVRTGILGTIPAWANVIEESTANGLGLHHERYTRQQDDPASRTRTVFYGWNQTPEYAAEPPEEFTSTEDERTLAAAHSLTIPQLVWRRHKRQEFEDEHKGHLFAQEFPLTAQEAFLASVTATYFDVEYLQGLLLRWKGIPPAQVILPHRGQLRGMLEIYEQPVAGVPYILGGDVSKGVVKGADGTEDRDYCTFDIARWDTREHVASYWGREGTSPEIHAADIAAIGLFFNAALAIIESNNHGRSTLNELVNHHKYPNVYFRKVSKTTPDGRLVENEEWGYETNNTTKPIADDYLQSELRSAAEGGPGLRLRGERAIRECMSYGHLAGGKAGALSGHDDHVRDLALISVVLREEAMPNSRKLEPRQAAAYTGSKGGRW